MLMRKFQKTKTNRFDPRARKERTLRRGTFSRGAGVSGLADFWLRDRVLGLGFYSFWALCLGPSAARRCKVVLLSMSLFW